MCTFPSNNLKINSSCQKNPPQTSIKTLVLQVHWLSFRTLAFPSPFFQPDTPKCAWKWGDAKPLAKEEELHGVSKKNTSSNCFCKSVAGCRILSFPLTVSGAIVGKLKCVLEILWSSRAEDKRRHCLFLYFRFITSRRLARPPSSLLPLLLLLTFAWLVPEMATFLNGSC